MAEEKPQNSASDPPKLNEEIQFIGDRNAILFSAEAGEPLPPLDLPDDFFELKKDDVRVLYKELKENREKMESMPFRTKAVREMEESMAMLQRLNRYTKTVVRIQFPDRLVVQAVFNHSDSIQTVMDFLRQFLDPPDVQFQLYTAPPKSVLRPESTMIEAKLTPRALVYFGQVPLSDRNNFLKPSLMSRLTSPKLASEAALHYRRKEENIEEDSTKETISTQSEPSTSSNQSNLSSTSKKSGSKSDKVPKWFKR